MTDLGLPRITLVGQALMLTMMTPLAHADAPGEIIRLINLYRTAPATCAGHTSPALPPLQARPVLAAVPLGPGRFLQQDLASAGYLPLDAEAIGVAGAGAAVEVVQLLRQQHCTSLRNPSMTDIGVAGTRNDWTVILAREDVVPPLPPQEESTRRVLAATNLARATARICGTQSFPPAPPLTANAHLDIAAVAHSTDMATLRYFSHDGRDGSAPADRATHAGYAGQEVGENIVSNKRTPEDAVAGWIASPGHCANLMNPHFTEMGSGFSKSLATGIVFWTQDLGRRE